MANVTYIIWLFLSALFGFIVGFIAIRIYEKVSEKVLIKNAEKIAEGKGKNTFMLDGKPTEVKNFIIRKESTLNKEKVIKKIPNKTKKGGKNKKDGI